MFERILSKSAKMIKIFVKIQCFFAFVVAIIVFFASINVASIVIDSASWVLVISAFLAVLVWFWIMSSAWTVYAFAELVEYTKATNEELSNMSKGLAQYTRATYEALNSTNKGLEAYTKAMGKTMNSMNRNLYIVAKYCCTEEEKNVPPTARKRGQQQINKEENDL